MSATHKFSVGPFQGWLVGKQEWEVRHNGNVVATARNMSDCCRAAERLNRANKNPDWRDQLDRDRLAFDDDVFEHGHDGD